VEQRLEQRLDTESQPVVSIAAAEHSSVFATKAGMTTCSNHPCSPVACSAGVKGQEILVVQSATLFAEHRGRRGKNKTEWNWRTNAGHDSGRPIPPLAIAVLLAHAEARHPLDPARG